MNDENASQDDSTIDADAKGISRRRLLGMGAAAAGAVAVGSVLRAGDASATATSAASGPAYPLAPAGSTLAATLLHGTPRAKGYRPVVTGPGESSVLRGELLGGATRSGGTRNPILSFGQFTDMHIIDAQSPARVEFLDRYNDPGNPLAASSPFSSAYRPWEMLTAHIAEAMVQAVNSLSGGPVAGRPLDFTICTGDNADNTQHNETRWHIDILDGRATVRPDSGSTSKWEGVGGPTDKDVSYWHPAGTPRGGKPDNYTATYGYPTVPTLHDKCRAPFTSTGLRTDWYSVFGNHDGLVQGTVPSFGVVGLIATGFLKATGLPAGVDIQALVAGLDAKDPAALQALLTLGPVKIVTADRNRKMQTVKQTVAEHFNTSGTPVGHGYTQSNITDNTAYYAFDRGPVRCIALDTVTPEGYDSGSMDKVQFAWLEAQLKASSARYLDTSGARVSNSSGSDKYILIFSHHTIDTMDNPLGVGRVLGPAVRDLLLRYPNVIAWVNGHTHVNSVTPHPRPTGTAVDGGFWEINTASHVDWPQQARVLELVDNGDATMSIFGTIIDHKAPTSWPANPRSPLELAALARELAINDPQNEAETADRDGRRGKIQDRNVELLIRKPF